MVFTSKSGFLGERTPVVTHRYSVKGYPMTSSHICVWKRKEFSFDSAVAFLRGSRGLSALYCWLLDPVDGIAKYMSWHFTEHLSALGSQQQVSVDLQAGL